MIELTEKDITNRLYSLLKSINISPKEFAKVFKALRLLDLVEKQRKELESEIVTITEKIENTQAEGRLDLIKQQNILFEQMQELQNLLEQSEKK